MSYFILALLCLLLCLLLSFVIADVSKFFSIYCLYVFIELAFKPYTNYSTPLLV